MGSYSNWVEIVIYCKDKDAVVFREANFRNPKSQHANGIVKFTWSSLDYAFDGDVRLALEAISKNGTVFFGTIEEGKDFPQHHICSYHGQTYSVDLSRDKPVCYLTPQGGFSMHDVVRARNYYKARRAVSRYVYGETKENKEKETSIADVKKVIADKIAEL